MTMLRTARETLREIARPVPPSVVEIKKKDGQTFSYVAWYDRLDLMDERCPLFRYEVVRDWFADVSRGSKTKGFAQAPMQHVLVRGMVPTLEGDIVRDQIGVDEEPDNQYGTPYERALAAGLSRLTAAFGLGRELYGGPASGARQRAIVAEAQRAAQPAPEAALAQPAPKPAPVAAPSGPPATNGKPAAIGAAKAADAPAQTPEHWTPAIEEAAASDAPVRMLATLWTRIGKETPNDFHRAGALAKCATAFAEAVAQLALADVTPEQRKYVTAMLGEMGTVLDDGAWPDKCRPQLDAAAKLVSGTLDAFEAVDVAAGA